jgi:hypothetical protein
MLSNYGIGGGGSSGGATGLHNSSGTASASGANSSSANLVDLGAPSYDEDIAEDRRKRILTK